MIPRHYILSISMLPCVLLYFCGGAVTIPLTYNNILYSTYLVQCPRSEYSARHVQWREHPFPVCSLITVITDWGDKSWPPPPLLGGAISYPTLCQVGEGGG